MTVRPVALLMLVAATAAAGQDLGARVAAAPDGQVRFSYAARPGIYGNGRNIISWDCRDGGGRCRNRQARRQRATPRRRHVDQGASPAP